MGCSFAGSRGEMTLTECFQDDRRLHHAIPQVPQGLPERGASAGSFFNAGEGLGARLLGPNDLTQNSSRKRSSRRIGRFTPFTSADSA